ncbi:DUF3320 domain-containing protein [Phytoactinopolyspora halophila]|uniref:DUF3320 domain-containing protein n=1 Tax=Phytoactinopolyspora halophila TaxID=1981511 RepID=UPI000F4F4D80|nr:DUF3320 domain-containing protein [Phytoactinopolyspora halophila]
MYAVVDLETTGLSPQRNRIVELAIVLVDKHGEIERRWCTLLNPERDLGAQHIHGISASDVLYAPTFSQVAGHVSDMLSSRIFVAHNITFDLGFMHAEYGRIGYTVPVPRQHGLCTMELAGTYLPGSGRTLADCCAAAGIEPAPWHAAEADALAAALLLSHYIRLGRSNGNGELGGIPHAWPAIDGAPVQPVKRGAASKHAAKHFLARISEHLPRHAEMPNADAYLTVLDQALLDRHISVTEADALLDVAAELELSRAAVEQLHDVYLTDLARAALADGVVTDNEREDLVAVAWLLGLADASVDDALSAARDMAEPESGHGRFELRPGDGVVFTGQMELSRDEWKRRAALHGLRPEDAVTSSTTMMVAADTDTMSGKARRARELGVPIIDEATFARMLERRLSGSPDEISVASGLPDPLADEERVEPQSLITIDAEAASILSYPMAHNQVPVVNRVTVSGATTTIRGAKMRMEIRDADGVLGTSQDRLVDLDASGPSVLTDLDLTVDPAAMLQVEEQRPAAIRLALYDDGSPLAERQIQVTMLAAHQWRTEPVSLALEMLAAFVMPNHPAVAQLVSEASDILERRTGRASVDGYQGGPERVDAIAQAIYEAMQARGIRYSEPPASWSDVGQKIRTPSEVLEDRVGTCLDLVVVMAAALEQAGVRPLLWIVDGHAFLGYWREEHALDGAASADAGDAVNLMHLGMIRLVETTAVTASDGAVPFAATHQTPAATYLTGDLSSVIGITDVRQARLAGIVPLPARVRDAGGSVTVVEYRAAEHATPAPARAEQRPEQSTSTGPAVPQRIQAWKNSLLDLSLRNRLINFTERTALELAVPDGHLPMVEDMLHEGTAVQLLPSDQFDSIHYERGARAGRDLPADHLAGMLSAKRATYTDVSSAAYRTRMRNLAYKARTIIEETGANNLYLALGSLVWTLDGRDLRSPLVLVPVRLTTLSRQTVYRIELDDSGTSTPNYCLLEKLRQRHGMEIPGLAEPSEDGAGIDLDAAFDAMRVALAERRLPFHVEPTAHLAILQFSKFRLWKDLDEHWQELSKSPLVSHLVKSPMDPFEDPCAFDAEQVDLDQVAERCPVPGDASQLEAVATAVGGATFVLEGPPGTGKSQTITNLLIRAVAEGKRVLFVAEKRAALDVVKGRLDRVGMTSFSLDLHDKGSKPAAVRAQIKQALEHSVAVDWQGLSAREQELRSARRTLDRYARYLHEENAAGLSLYSAHTQRLAMDSSVPALHVPRELLTSSAADTVAEIRHVLNGLPEVADVARPRPHHPWGFIDSPQAGSIDVAAVRDAVLELDAAVDSIPATGPLADVVRAVRTMDDLVVLAAFASAPHRSLEVLDQVPSPQWESAAAAFTQQLAQFAATHTPALGPVTAAALDLPLPDIHARAQAAAASGFFGRKKRLVAVRDELEGVMRRGGSVKPKQLPALTEALLRVQAAVQGLAADAATVPGILLPATWNPLTDEGRDLVDEQLNWLRWVGGAIRERADGDPSGEFILALRQALKSNPFSSAESELAVRLRDATSRLADVCLIEDSGLAAWSGGDGLVARWQQTRDGRDTASPEMWSLRRWLDLLAHVEPLRVTGMMDARRALLSGAVDADDAVQAFERGIAESSVEERRAATGLVDFDAHGHERAISRFTTAAGAVRNAMSDATPAHVIRARPFDPETSLGRVGELRREIGKQRRGLSVRKLMEKYGDLVAGAMPCVLVSPDSLARFFPPRAAQFDLVVFDEASQIRVADAIGAIGRAKSVVVVGDSKQMPPTSFAEPSTPGDDDESMAEGAVEDEESILSECVQARVTQQWLSWHYRSQDESLIAFSNHQYYENKLSTFPAPSALGSADHGVTLERVDGHFHRTGKGKLLRTNPVEAEAVVAEIQRRFDASSDAAPSVGVVTFNQQQRAYIEALIRDSDDPRLAEALDGSDEEGLFVKNLENVQGDERDVILFSTAFSVNDRGVLPLNFGPLNRAGGERRLNVAITRARRRVIVFSSFDPSQLRAEETSSVGIKHLRAYLDMAEQGTATLPNNPYAATVADRHAEDIAARLRDRGLAVITNVGLSDFKVDISVASADAPEHALLAVLLDGPAWAARRTVGDRDGLPSEVLVQLLHWPAVERVWLPAWLDGPDAVVDRLVRAVDDVLSGTRRESNDNDENSFGPAEPSAPANPEPARPSTNEFNVVDEAVEWRAEAEPAIASPIASAAVVDSEPRSSLPAEPGALPGQSTYVPWTPRILGTVETLDGLGRSAASNNAVAAVLEQVIEAEGPVHIDRLVKLVASAFGLSKVHASRRDAILQQLPKRYMPDSAESVAWPGSLDYRTWTGFRASVDGDERKFDHVSLREMINAMAALCTQSAGMLEPELKREAMNIFGGRRMTERVSERLDRAIELGLSSGRLERGPDELIVA